MLDKATALRVVRDDTARLLDAASTDPALPVPSCPGWSLADLVRHVGRIHQWCAANVATLADERVAVTFDDPDDPAELIAWAVAQGALLLEVLGRADPRAPMWTHPGPGTAAYWHRRMAHEVSVHRWDAEHAIGRSGGFDVLVAADGAAEFLEVYATHRDAHGALRVAADPLTLHLDDASTRWTLTADADGFSVAEGEDEPAALTATGSAADTLLTLWGRVPPTTLRWSPADDPRIAGWFERLHAVTT